MADCESAQAMEFIRALRDQLRQMTARLVWVERQLLTAKHGRASAIRLEAAALRRDIAEAEVHIDRLQRRYLSHTTDTHADLGARTAARRLDGRTGPAVRR
jgi:hypothetical protein